METAKIITTRTSISIVTTNNKQRFFFIFAAALCVIIIITYCKLETNIYPKKVFSIIHVEEKHARSKKKLHVLSYCIFGTKKKWAKRIGIVASEVRKSELYFNWTIRVYHDGSFKKRFLKKYTNNYKNIDFYDVRNLPLLGDVSSYNAMVWRFLPLDDNAVDVMCSRDLDSPILKREESAVKEWLNSGKLMHVMRDHKKHSAVILGGLWCYRNSKNRVLASRITRLILDNADRRTPMQEVEMGNDQIILKKFMWPFVRNDTLQHDSYLCKRYKGTTPYPSKREDNRSFIGCKRVCNYEIEQCPKDCRPSQHKDWLYC